MANYANRVTDRCFATVETLCEATGLTPRALSRARALLVRKKLCSKMTKRDGWSGRSACYRLHVRDEFKRRRKDGREPPETPPQPGPMSDTGVRREGQGGHPRRTQEPKKPTPKPERQPDSNRPAAEDRVETVDRSAPLYVPRDPPKPVPRQGEAEFEQAAKNHPWPVAARKAAETRAAWDEAADEAGGHDKLLACHEAARLTLWKLKDEDRKCPALLKWLREGKWRRHVERPVEVNDWVPQRVAAYLGLRAKGRDEGFALRVTRETLATEAERARFDRCVREARP
jgi:hypothetical protein